MLHGVFKEALLFKKLVETLKGLVTDFNLVATPTKLSFQGLDNQYQALVVLRFDSAGFKSYTCTYKSLQLGVSLAYLEKAMKLG